MASNTLGWNEWGTNLTNGDGVTRPTSFAAETAATTDPTFRINTELFGQQSTDNLTNALAESGKLWAMDWASGLGESGGDGMDWGSVIGGGLSLLGGMKSGDAATEAARATADANVKAAQIAADAARFRPVGITTNFGQSNFGYDANGNLNSAGYSLNPQSQGLFNSLQGMNAGNLQNYQNAGTNNQGLFTGSQSMMGLGNQYLQANPQDVEAKYMADQQRLLAPQNAQEYAKLQNTMEQQGRNGLAIGGGEGMMATNPELAAYYNSLAQQNNTLAANATKAGMDYSNFGASMVNQGGAGMNSYYNNLSASGQPLQNNLSMMQGIDAQGQQSMALGAGLGGQQAAAGALSGGLYQKGVQQASPYQYAANSYSPAGTALSGMGNMFSNYNGGQNQNPNWWTANQNNNNVNNAMSGQSGYTNPVGV